MMYSSAVFKEPCMSLEQASDYKKELICQNFNCKPMDHLVEITADGEALPFMRLSIKGHHHYHFQAQYDEALARVAEAGLSHRVSVQLQDYRLLEGKYDKLVSIEMGLEAVGEQIYQLISENAASSLSRMV